MNFNRRQLLQGFGVLCLTPTLPRWAWSNIPALEGPTMGTRYRIQVRDRSQSVYLPTLKGRIERVLTNIDTRMSLYRHDSELSQFNQSPALHWKQLSKNTADIIATALDIHQHSGGAFNPLTAARVDDWGFGPAARSLKTHAFSEPFIAPISAPVPEADTQLQLAKTQIRKHDPDTTLDLNGIAKGAAVDQLAAVIAESGIDDYLVEIGGEIRTGGRGPSGNGWLVGIENPSGGLASTIELSNQAIATSGDYIHFFIHQGRRFSHLIDPRTGNPVQHNLALVSVIADHAIEADAWATALMIMGPEQGWQFALEHEMPALFGIRGYTDIQFRTTPFFGRYNRKIP